MLILYYPLFLKKVLTKQTWYSIGGLISIVLLLILITGCSREPLTLRQLPTLLPELSSEANFQISVTPSGSKGVYTVEGRTNLPNKSRIGVAAIRYLRPDNQLSENLNLKPTYSILDYQDVEVNNGEWQIDLELWKIAPDGQFQEAWQLEQPKLGLKLEPETEVTFLATLAPTDPLAEIERQLQRQGIKLVKSLVRNTVDGERYVQALQVLPVALPTGKTTPPKELPENVNGGWGPRYLLLPEPPNINNLEMPSERRTDAPLSPAEFL